MAGNHVEAVVSQFVLNFSVSLTIFLLGNSVYSNARYSRRIHQRLDLHNFNGSCRRSFA